jgi:hypothetical protein
MTRRPALGARVRPDLGYATRPRYMAKGPPSRVERDPRENYAWVGFRMVNRLLTHQRLSNGHIRWRAEGVYS